MEDKIIISLKEFYILEKFQVAYYQAQADSATDEYYRKAFSKMVAIEQGHADFFAAKILKAKEKVPKIVGSVFDLAGEILGETVELFGRHNTCKVSAALENRAVKMYREFIRLAKKEELQDLKDTLMDYLLDEEFHILWLNDYMSKHP
ncbi:MAG: ferritin-like domain-containing protein [Peptococcaceae bacterium]|nr:ferritin-like domain-containing protein [Peptococcaceae bacterium]